MIVRAHTAQTVRNPSGINADEQWERTVVGKPLPRGFVAQHLYPFIDPPKKVAPLVR